MTDQDVAVLNTEMGHTKHKLKNVSQEVALLENELHELRLEITKFKTRTYTLITGIGFLATAAIWILKIVELVRS